MRDLDDKVIYALNMSLPTASIKARTDSNPGENCSQLYSSLKKSYEQRGKVIQDCILLTAEEVSQLKKQREGSYDVQVEKKFKTEQRKVRS
jgi:Caffeine-induced death protein 2